jgi:anthranilate synthase/aminodeoxychorismate synthase-like glutamine amidotransferase
VTTNQPSGVTYLPLPTALPDARPIARVLMIDNYDSFTFNLVQAMLELGAAIEVYRNDAITTAHVRLANDHTDTHRPGHFTHLVISPGPGTPYDAGVSMDMLRHFAGKLPILGVCLGHQSMAEVFGGAGAVARAPRLMHGKSSLITHDSMGLYQGLPPSVEVGRYHSLCVLSSRVPPGFVVTSQTDQGEIMGIRSHALRMEGVQFHPESVLTPSGPAMLARFLSPSFLNTSSRRDAEPRP